MSVLEVKARAQKSLLRSDKWLLVVECPFCGGSHAHSAGVVVKGHNAPLAQFYGERYPLCHNVHKKSYFLVAEGKR